MKLCQVKYCDFVIWGKDIKCNEEFIENALLEVKSFVKLYLLPELLSQCFTNGMKNPSDCKSLEGNDQLPSQDDITVQQSANT